MSSPLFRDSVDELGLAGDVGLVPRLLRLNLVLGRRLEALAGVSGLSAGDGLVLAVVQHAPGHRATPSWICDVLDRTTGGMTLTLDRLATAGLLRRSTDPDDRRRVVVELTPEGLAVAARFRADLHAWETALGLSPTRAEEARRVLDRLLDDVVTAEEGAGDGQAG